MTNMKPEERPETVLDYMLSQQMQLLYTLQDMKDRDEYGSINMNMTNICRELNNLRIKQITENED